MTVPTAGPPAGLPPRVHIREEGPRDGWQNIEAPLIPTEEKVAQIEALAEAGLARITATSLVSPRWVPQLADGPEVLRRLRPRPGVRYGVLRTRRASTGCSPSPTPALPWPRCSW